MLQKSLYSLMLMDDVVREIDRLALQQNTNRSNFINQILAEYVSLMTPEKRIGNIFKNIEALINQCGLGIVPHVVPNQMTMSLKSSLEYKYRPTIRYEVALYRIPDGNAIGELSVVFRTQSPALIRAMTEFFRLWTRLESIYKQGEGIRYALYEGKFTRTIQASPDRNHTNEEIGNHISSYIQLFDRLLKSYVSGEYGPQELERIYLEYFNKGAGLI